MAMALNDPYWQPPCLPQYSHRMSNAKGFARHGNEQ